LASPWWVGGLNFHDRPKRPYLTGCGKGVRLHAIRASSLLLAENFLTIILRWLSSSCIGRDCNIMARLVLSGAGWAVKRPEHGRVVWLHQHVFQAEAIVSFLISVVRSSHDVMVHRDISDMNGKDSGTGRVRPAKIASEITEYQPWKDRVECHPVQYQWAKKGLWS